MLMFFLSFLLCIPFCSFIKEIQGLNQKVLVSCCSTYPKGRCKFELTEVNMNRSGICTVLFLGSGTLCVVKLFLINSRMLIFINLIYTEMVYPLL